MDMKEIKTSRLRYVECGGGGLHQGELMNLVCVDGSCTHRGLICPVCRMETHDNHHILPIKSFLTQIQTLFLRSPDSEDLNNLSDYLLSLQTSKKHILGAIRIQVEELAQCFRDLELQVEESYVSLRRNVLIQASITTKLPGLVTLLGEEGPKDPFEVQREFRNYCELLRFQNQKIKISDKAKKIVESYAQIKKKVSDLLEPLTSQYKAKLKLIPSILDQKQIENKIASIQNEFTLSLTDKTTFVTVEGPTATIINNDDHGFVFVNQPFDSNHKSLVFTIENNGSYEVLVGIGNLPKFREVNFMHSQDRKIMHFVISDGASSETMGEDCEGSEENSVIQGQPCFNFNDTGTKVRMSYNSDSNSLELQKLGSGQKYSLKLKHPIKGDSNWKFCFGLGLNDKIRISRE